jgi:hypothetical protein
MQKPVIFLFLFSFFFSCEEEPETTYLDERGVVQGVVSEEGATDPMVGATVKLRGLHYNQSQPTTSFGAYKFEKVHTSNYELEVTKEGYGKQVVVNIAQSGSDTLNHFVTLHKIPDYNPLTISDPVVEFYGSYIYQAKFYGTAERSGKFRAFFATSNDVSNRVYQWTYHFTHAEGQFNFTTYFPDLRKNDPNEKLFMKIYSDGGGQYYDFIKDEWVYSALNVDKASKVFEFTFQ